MWGTMEGTCGGQARGHVRTREGKCGVKGGDVWSPRVELYVLQGGHPHELKQQFSSAELLIRMLLNFNESFNVE